MPIIKSVSFVLLKLALNDHYTLHLECVNVFTVQNIKFWNGTFYKHLKTRSDILDGITHKTTHGCAILW